MKLIILSAFGGRLRGDPMEWPDEPPEILMNVSPMFPRGFQIGKDADLTAPLCRVARFQPTHTYEVLPGQRTAAVYELVDM